MARYHVRVAMTIEADRRGLAEAPDGAAGKLVSDVSRVLAAMGVSITESRPPSIVRIDKVAAPVIELGDI